MKRIFTAIILSTTILYSWAQSAVNYTLNTPITTTASYTARDFVKMNAGFKFTSTGATTFSAKTDQKLLFNVSYVTNPVAGGSRVLDTGKEVGAIPGGASVSSDGTAQYAIPIEVAPGINGLAPGFGINYSSASGNGLLGWGWSLGGISSITRGTKSYHQDGEVTNISFDQNDRLFLDGQLLICTYGTYGITGSTYTTEVYQPTKIYLKGTEPNLYFEVMTPNGLVSKYAQIYVSNSKNVYWTISEVKDPEGNTIQYFYSTQDGQLVLDYVTYANNRVDFYYGQRICDKNFSYLNGIKLSNNLLLRKITATNNGEPYREYGFDYSYQLYSHLYQVTLRDGGGKEVNSTIIDWGLLQTAPTVASSTVTHKYVKYYGDFNGDGVTDILSKDKDAVNYQLAINLGNGTTFSIYTFALANPSDKVLIANYDNDWDDDVIVLTRNTRFEGSHPDFITYQDYFVKHFNFANNTLTENVNSRVTVTQQTEDVYDTELVFGDFNGDGLHDELLFTKTDWTSSTYNYGCIYSNISNVVTNPATIVIDMYLTGIAGIIPIHSNANRKLDLSVKTINASQNYDRFYNYEFDKGANKFLLACNDTISKSVLIADFNGDGIDDYCPRSINTENFNISYGKGNGKFENIQGPFSLFIPDNILYPYEVLDAADLNGDGKSDIIRYYFTVDIAEPDPEYPGMVTYTPVIHAKAYLSKGAGFGAVDMANLFNNYICPSRSFYDHSQLEIESDILLANVPIPTEISYIEGAFIPKYQLIDLNGDGNSDLFVKRPLENVWDIGFIETNAGACKVSTITNGMNIQSQFEYKPLTDASVYSKTTDGASPLYHVKTGSPVVKTLILTDGATVFAQTGYFYTNANTHPEFGFMGFDKTEETNTVTQMKATTDYEFIGDLCLPMQKTVTTVHTSAGAYSTAALTNSATPVTYGANKTYQVRNTQSVATNHLTGTVVTSTNASYNTYNIPTIAATSYGTAMAVTRTTTYNNVEPGTYFLLRVTNEEIKYDHADEASYKTVTTGYSYYPANPNRLYQKTLFKGTDKERVETYSEYETFGGIKKITTTADAVTRYKTFSYTPCNRFVDETTTSGAFKQTYEYDPQGRLITAKDYNNLSTVNQYGAFGQPVKTLMPDSNSVSQSVYWGTAGPPGTAYVIEKTASGRGTAKMYYNRRGQLLRTDAPGPLGNTLKSEVEYYTDGRVKRQYLPHTSAVASKYTEYVYDAFGRLTSQATPQGTTTIGYSGKTVTTTRPDGWGQAAYDDYGLVKSTGDDGGTVTYTYYNTGQVHTTGFSGSVTTFAYDNAGNLTQQVEPNSGTTSYTYNKFGELTQVNQNSKITGFQYDVYGRPIKKTVGADSYDLVYDPTTQVLTDVKLNSAVASHFTYTPGLLQLSSETKYINSQSFVTSYTYNNLSQVATVTYPGNYSVKYTYDASGAPTTLKNNATGALIWQLDGISEYGMTSGYTYGNGLTTQLTYDSQLRPDVRKTSNNTSIFNWKYVFNAATGNLTSRTDYVTGQSESFTYDALSRLTGFGSGKTVSYAVTGNISTKTDAGTYAYDATRKNAVSDITDPQGGSLTMNQSVTYNVFNKPLTLGVNGNQWYWTFEYGYDQQRQLMKSYIDGALSETKYYVGNYEKRVTAGGTTKEFTYISAPGAGLVAVHVKPSSGTEALYYVHTDYLGSIMALTNSSGTLAEKYFYDAWGNKKNPANWALADSRTSWIVDRGYTAHEHLDNAGLINMNGRLYDPQLGRMLNADPFTSPGTQGMNRYSYVLNNPLKYTDPSGYHAAPLEPDENDPYRKYSRGGGYSDDLNGGGQYSYSHYRRYSFSAANARADAYFGSGGYYYDWTSGTYHENYSGAEVRFSTVNNNYILPNSITLKPIQIQRNSIIPELNPNSLTAGDGNFMGLGDLLRTFPEFSILWSNYPQDIDGESQHPSSDSYANNQCAIRLGLCLLLSGIDISDYNTGPVTSEGYPRGAKSLADWIWQNYGSPTIVSVTDFQNNYSNQTGIMFEYASPGNTSHIDLWNAGVAGSGFYTVGYREIWFWPIN